MTKAHIIVFLFLNPYLPFIESNLPDSVGKAICYKTIDTTVARTHGLSIGRSAAWANESSQIWHISELSVGTVSISFTEYIWLHSVHD